VEHTRPLEHLWQHLRGTGEQPDAVWADVRNALARLMAALHPSLVAPLGDFNTAAHGLLFLPKVRFILSRTGTPRMPSPSPRFNIRFSSLWCFIRGGGLYRIGKWPIKRHLRTIRH
jgi:hypothetical protein